MLRVDFEFHLEDFHLRPQFEAGSELVVLFGPSGCGKSLTLQAIAGLLRAHDGRIELPGGRVAFDSGAGIDIPPQRRNVGYVVQELALFPHLDARQNIEFGIAGWPATERRKRVGHLVSLLGLEGLERRHPREMSGGQQQRVALARALAAEPSLLLLDEPFSSLDAPLRGILRRELAALRRRLDVTALFVTHDLNEAYALADRIVVLDDGAVLQQGSRDEIFRRPASRRVAELVETRNIIPGTVDAYAEGVAIVRTPWFTARVRDPAAPITGKVYVCIRPEHVLVLREGHEARENSGPVLDAEIAEEQATASNHRLFLRVPPPDGELGVPCLIEADVPAHPYEVLGIRSRPDWRITLAAEHITLVPRE